MRVKTGTVRRAAHKKVLKAAKGFWMSRHKKYKVAHEAVMHSGMYAFKGRKLRRRDMRQVWITRLNAALRPFEVSYSAFIKMMKDKKVELNRKMLSEIAINDNSSFKSIIEFIKK